MPFDGRLIEKDEVAVVGFAGGGGSCEGYRLAIEKMIVLGLLPVDFPTHPAAALNHDGPAIAMHAANFPGTIHYQANIWRVDPDDVGRDLGGAPIGFAWFSPDCKHFSKAKGGKPRAKHIRDLAWVVPLWAKRKRPRVIAVENVEEFLGWGPLLEDGTPCPVQKGVTFKLWVRELRKLGYRVEWRELRGCDYGAPTSRNRLFVIARCDGEPIVWPAPTHGPGLLPYRTAADCIDFSIPCPSIFLTKEEGRAIGVKRPLAENTFARIGKGVWRYVLLAAKPFIVPCCGEGGDLNSATMIQMGYGERKGQAPRALDIKKPLGTLVGTGKHALVVPHLMTMRNAQKPHTAGNEPTHTITAGGAHLNLVSAFLEKHAPDEITAAHMAQFNTNPSGSVNVGHEVEEPVSSLTGRGPHQAVVASSLVKLRGTSRHGQPVDQPLHTVSAQGTHFAEVRAFLVKYYDTAVGAKLSEPMHCATTRARFALVKVWGELYRIVDMGMRMLTPRELFRAQGFRDSYIIDLIFNGKPLTKAQQISLVGNSVCPDIAQAIVFANYRPRLAQQPAMLESAE